MYRIYELNPYTAVPEGFFLDLYDNPKIACKEVDALVKEASEAPYNEPYLYAVYENGACLPYYIKGFSGSINRPIPEYQGLWETIINHLIDDFGQEYFEVYKRWYTQKW